MKFKNKFEDRFSYVDDDNLREHMAEALEYITKITYDIAEKKGPINMQRKTCILYTSSLIEANIHYCIKKLGYTETTSKKEWEYTMREELKTELEGEKLILSTRRRKKICLDKGDFNLLNSFACNNLDVYDKKIFKEVDYARKLRNKIHIQSLEDIDKKFTDKQMNRIFVCARVIFKQVEKKLK